MMDTPIKNFIDEYVKKDGVRLHMPGHKGCLGYERDITEIAGADSLYEADGIIAESEKNASVIFESYSTSYSAGGSSQSIKAMCYLAMRNTLSRDNTIIAGRNAHKSFIHASMLLGFDIAWLPSEDKEYSVCTCAISADGLRAYIRSYKEKNPTKHIAAVYVTSPDYLGNIQDIEALSRVAHEEGTILICDNAHGAYLKFLEGRLAGNASFPDMHPLTLGADMTCDSAHKTLPVLTGGAYLHISKTAPESLKKLVPEAKQALQMFGSTSPSYLIMESLDRFNGYITSDEYKESFEVAAGNVMALKFSLRALGYRLVGNEPLKVTIDAENLELTGIYVAEALRAAGIEVEFADPDYIVTMWSPQSDFGSDVDRFMQVMSELSVYLETEGASVGSGLQMKNLPVVKYSPRETMLMSRETVRVDESIIGRVVAEVSLGCPPAVCPVVAGEIINMEIIQILKYYGIDRIDVLTL